MTKTDFLKDIFNPLINPVLTAEGIYVDKHAPIAWYGYLGHFHPATIKKVMINLTSKPIPRQIRDACRQEEERQDIKCKTVSGVDRQGNHYRDLMKWRSADWDMFKRRLQSGEPLSEEHEKARDIVNPYIMKVFGYFNLKESLKNVTSGFYHSYHGLFCEAISGELKPLTGKSYGNINYKVSQ